MRLCLILPGLVCESRSGLPALYAALRSGNRHAVWGSDALCIMMGSCLIRRCPTICCCWLSGFRVLEMGAGTGGLTKDALPLLDCDLHHELLRYCATDITSAFSTGLIESVKSPKLVFKARRPARTALPRAWYISPG